MKLPNKNSHQVFKTRRVRYASADELELYSSSTTSPVKRRQTQTYVEVLLLFTQCRWMSTSTARQECATLSVYTTSRTTDTAPMLSFAGCQSSTALTSLFCSIRSRVEVNLLMCAVSMLVGAHRNNCSRFVCRYGFHEDILDSVDVPILLYCCTRIQYFALAIILSDSGERMQRDKIRHNECTQHVVSFHGGHVVPSDLQSSTATVKDIVVWNSWSRRYPRQMRENLLPVHIIRRQKATTL